MASSMALKRLLSSSLLPRTLSSPLRPAAAFRRFNSDALREYRDDHDDERGVDVDRRSDRQSMARRLGRDDFLSDVFDPFSPTRSLSQVLNLMDQFMANPFLSSAAQGGGIGGGMQRGWEARETDEALHLRVDMPGLGKEDVKVSVEQNTLTIRGEGEKEEESSGGGRRYMSRIELPEKLYRSDQIKAEMKNGVLKVVVPKVKENERSDVFHVNVE